jgi:hypothetical protein
MTRRYCEVADTDVKKAHMLASPIDNMDLRARNKIYRNQDSKTRVFPKGVKIKERDGYLSEIYNNK